MIWKPRKTPSDDDSSVRRGFYFKRNFSIISGTAFELAKGNTHLARYIRVCGSMGYSTSKLASCVPFVTENSRNTRSRGLGIVCDRNRPGMVLRVCFVLALEALDLWSMVPVNLLFACAKLV